MTSFVVSPLIKWVPDIQISRVLQTICAIQKLRIFHFGNVVVSLFLNNFLMMFQKCYSLFGKWYFFFLPSDFLEEITCSFKIM